ncbi:hypothetical protein ACIBI9_55940 [Nonomuraea sp. NPDC050451]|uniref:hypothetical protein n=1 Tax=Nonomuraea sp. NPDC050451 TaxID=3364364 RepID=UPI00379AF452
MFGEQRDDLWLWGETGERRQAQNLNTATAAKVDQYVAAVETFSASNTVILALADELAAGTFEATPAKSDLELGVETLAEAPARQANPFPVASPVHPPHPPTRWRHAPAADRQIGPASLVVAVQAGGSKRRLPQFERDATASLSHSN